MASLSAGVVLLSVLARYLGRRKTSRPVRRPRIVSGRRTRNSMRSPNGNIAYYKQVFNVFSSDVVPTDVTSLAGSKVSARSISPGGSVVALSDRMSLASGSLPGTEQDNPLSPQQLGVMGKIYVLCFSNVTIYNMYTLRKVKTCNFGWHCR